MAKKVPVLVHVDPKKGTTIKPFAAEIATAVKQAKGTMHPMLTGSATVTYNNGAVDGDATVD